jgi:hypothetical protein
MIFISALLNLAVLVTVGVGQSLDKLTNPWSGQYSAQLTSTSTVFLSWSYWCVLPPCVVALIDGLCASYAAHKHNATSIDDKGDATGTDHSRMRRNDGNKICDIENEGNRSANVDKEVKDERVREAQDTHSS